MQISSDTVWSTTSEWKQKHRFFTTTPLSYMKELTSKQILCRAVMQSVLLASLLWNQFYQLQGKKKGHKQSYPVLRKSTVQQEKNYFLVRSVAAMSENNCQSNSWSRVHKCCAQHNTPTETRDCMLLCVCVYETLTDMAQLSSEAKALSRMLMYKH